MRPVFTESLMGALLLVWYIENVESRREAVSKLHALLFRGDAVNDGFTSLQAFRGSGIVTGQVDSWRRTCIALDMLKCSMRKPVVGRNTIQFPIQHQLLRIRCITSKKDAPLFLA